MFLLLMPRHDWTRLEKWKKRQHAVVSLFDLSNFTSLLITHSHGADSRTIVFQLEMKIKTSLFRKIKVKPTRKRRDTNKYPEEENKCSTMKISISSVPRAWKLQNEKLFSFQTISCVLFELHPQTSQVAKLFIYCVAPCMFFLFFIRREKKFRAIQ